MADVTLPEYAGIYSHDFFNNVKGQSVTKEDIQKFVEESLKDKNLSDSVTYTVDDTSFNSAQGNTGGYGRDEVSGDITVTLSDGTTTKTVKVKALFYKPPYAVQSAKNNDGRKYETSHDSHNAGKLNVANPNDYTLTNEQKTKLINDFKSANTKLGLSDKATYVMDDQGNLTITDNSLSTTISKDWFISDIAYVPDIIVFQNLDKNGNGTTSSGTLTKPIEILLRKDKQYADFWKMNGTGIAHTGWPKNLQVEKKEENGEVKFVITGSYEKLGTTPNKSKGRYEIWGKYGLGIHNADGLDYKQSFSNVFKVRVLRTQNKTIIRCVDDDKKHINFDAEVKSALDINWDALKAYNSPDDPNGTTDEQIRTQIKARVHQKLDATNATLKHKVGKQTFKAKFVTDQGNESSSITATTIYYTEKISDTLVKNPAYLTSEEKATIKDKIKKANNALNLGDDDVVVTDDGRVTLKIADPNSKEKDGKTEVSFKAVVPMVTATYADKEEEVAPTESKKITSSVSATKGSNAFTFPESTTFELPKGEGVTNPAGVKVNSQSGEIEYTVPKATTPGNDTEDKVVEGDVLAKLPNDQHSVRVHYKFTIKRPSYAKVKYVTEDGKEIDAKFRAEVEGQYPTEKRGTRDQNVVASLETGFTGPKFVGYTFKKTQVDGSAQTYTPKKEAILKLVYTKIDEIIPAKTADGQDAQKPEGYVKVTFKADNHSKIAGKTEDVVYYVNPKAGVKLQNDGESYKLVGKNASDTELKKDVPAVTADENYHVYTEKDGETDTKWGYTGYDTVKATDGITSETIFTSRVKENNNSQLEPNYTNAESKPGETKTIAVPTFSKRSKTEVTDEQKTNALKDVSYTAVDDKDLPDGVTKNQDGTYKVTIKSKEEGKTVTAKVTVNQNGSLSVVVPEDAKDGEVINVPVKVTYNDGTFDTAHPTVTVVDQSQKFTPSYEEQTKKPGDTVELPIKKTETNDFPQGTTFAKEGEGDFTVGTDGKVSLTVPSDKKTGDTITGKVKVTYPDNTTDIVDFTVKVTNQQGDYEPSYDAQTKKPGETAEATLKIAENKVIPTGTTFEKVGETAGVTVDPQTGEVTVNVPQDAKDGSTITAQVKVKYPDGTEETVDAVVNVADQSQQYTPAYTDKTGKPGESVTVPTPSFTGKDGNAATVPQGTKYELGENVPQGVTVDSTTGVVTVPVGAEAKDGDEITVPVKVTYPDGTTETVNAKVTVKDQHQQVEPKYTDQTGKPGDSVTVPTPSFTGKDGNAATAPQGTTYAKGDNAPDGVTVNQDGSITVTVPEGTADGTEITVPVVVTYPDGTKDTVNAKVTVSNEAGKYNPTGGKVEKNFGEPTTADDVIAKVTTDYPTTDPNKKPTVKVKDGQTLPDGKTAGNFPVTLVVTYPDGTTEEVTVTVTVKQPVSPAPVPGGDSDNGGSTDVTVPEVVLPAPTIDQVAPNARVVTGEATPGAEVTVTFPDGTQVTTTADANGKFTVKVPAGVSLQDGDKITAVAKKDGSTSAARSTVVKSNRNAQHAKGEQLPQTGAGVALTALAVTVLAGMGAALRKFRH